jgi:hypothetical protein
MLTLLQAFVTGLDEEKSLQMACTLQFLNPVRRACHHVQDQMSTPSPMRTWPLNLRLFGWKCAGHGKFDSLQGTGCGDPQVRTGMPRHLLLLSGLCGVTCAGSCEVDMVHSHGAATC